MGHVRDLWTDPPPAGATKRIRNERWGHGKRWLANWTEDGRVKTRAFTVKDAALDWVAARDLGLPVARPTSTVTVRELAATWQAAQLHHRATTAAAVSSTMSTMILPSLGDQLVVDLNRATLQQAVATWTGTWSPARIRVAWSYVTSMLTLAELDGLIPRRPAGIRLPPIETDPVEPLTAGQVLAIADAVPDRWRSLVIVAAASGLRSGELRGLTWDRVAGGVLVVDRQLVGADRLAPVFGPLKSRSSRRQVPIGEVAQEALDEQRRRWPTDDLVWRTRLRTPLSRTAASGVWRDATLGMGLRGRSGWHDLRHFHASLLIASGLSPVAVAHRLGHKDATETLRTYAHLWPTDEARAVAVVDAELAGFRASVENSRRTGTE